MRPSPLAAEMYWSTGREAELIKASTYGVCGEQSTAS